MLHINIICIGKLKEKYLKDAIDEYSKRLKKYCILDILELLDEKIPDKLNMSIKQSIINTESDKVLNTIKDNSYVIALDLNGKEYSSESFSKNLQNICLNSSSNITFIIGGSLGLSERLLNKCNELICFSKLTFPHQLIRIFLLEQLFRAFKIANNESYHK